MKISEIIKNIKVAQKADQSLYKTLSVDYYCATVSEIYDRMWIAYLSLAVGDEWEWYKHQVGRAISKDGGYIIDNITSALCWDYRAGKAKKNIEEGWEFIFEKSMLHPALDYKEYSNED